MPKKCKRLHHRVAAIYAVFRSRAGGTRREYQLKATAGQWIAIKKGSLRTLRLCGEFIINLC